MSFISMSPHCSDADALLPEIGDVQIKGVERAAHHWQGQTDNGGRIAFDAVNEPAAHCFQGEGTGAVERLAGVGICCDIGLAGLGKVHCGGGCFHMALVAKDEAVAGK